MNLLFSSFRRKAGVHTATARAARSPVRPMRLARTFVETGDERCPLAGIWSRLSNHDPATHNPEPEDPEIARPVMGTLLPWRAFNPLLTAFPYRTL